MKGAKMKIVKQFIKAVVWTYAFIFVMMLGLILMLNVTLSTTH